MARSVSVPYSFMPPVRGLTLNETLASSDQGGARVLDNWFPTVRGARVRGGSRKYATIGTSPVQRLFSYKSGSLEQFFASDEENIFDITSPSDVDTPPTPDVTGQSGGYYSTAQFGTSGGDFLYAVNGLDHALLYDGTTWKPMSASSTPAFTGVATTGLSFVWSFANRLWFVQKNTMSAWYLPTNAIAGAAVEFPLSGVFQEGGVLVMGGKWSLDAGNGLDDKCLFISSLGEVAVYQGTDPSSISTWEKVGVYKITPAMGINGTMSSGGDFLVATEDGIVPISQAVNKDAAALTLAAVTRAVEPEWKKRVSERNSMPWEIMKWPSNNMMVVSTPSVDASQPYTCLVANLQTGAWSTFSGWDIRCMALVAKEGYFGTSGGTIHQMEVGGSDDDAPYSCAYVGMPDQMGSPGAIKIVHSARGTFTANIPFRPKLSASTNYRIKLPSAPSSEATTGASLWDVGTWDVSTWDGGTEMTVLTRWASIGRSGYAVSPQVQVTCSGNVRPLTELIQFDVLYEQGGVMV